MTKNEKFDGERIKSTLICKSLSNFLQLDIINLSTHKIFNSLRIILMVCFNKKKYQYIIISKDSRGANIIHRILRLVHFPVNRIIYFEIGPFLYDRILDGSIKKENFISDKLIVVETNSMKNELQSLGFKRVDVFPNFKPICKIDFNEQKYPKDVLRLVYLSRIEEQKGIYDLIDTLTIINKNKIKFVLDIFGRPQSKSDNQRIQELSAKYKFVNYFGMLDVGIKENYEMLSNYDLHIFPTKYKEGFPGTLIDFFIAGVPSLSSTFARAHEILSTKDSLFYKQNDNNDLINKLNYVYNNQSILNELRINTFNKREVYSVEAFEFYLGKIISANFD